MNILNIAHRGDSGSYPENTMLSFEKAIENGCDGIETDVQLTRDGIAVLCHDERIDRTADGTGFVKDYTYKELLKFDFGIKFGEEFKGLRIPTLSEFLDLSRRKNIFIDLEIKTGVIFYKDIEKLIIKSLYDNKMEKQSILSSFNHYSLVDCKKIDSSIKTGMLYVCGMYHPEVYAKSIYVDAIHPLFYSINSPELIEPVKKSNLKINPYTVNDEYFMRRMIELKVDGIITNYPERLRGILNEK